MTARRPGLLTGADWQTYSRSHPIAADELLRWVKANVGLGEQQLVRSARWDGHDLTVEVLGFDDDGATVVDHRMAVGVTPPCWPAGEAQDRTREQRRANR